MRPGDTSLGGPHNAFPDTTWGLLSRLRDAGDPGRRHGFETLFVRYWKPVYHYLRAAMARSNDEAKDLTQSFFAWILEGDALTRFDPARGGFRTFLKMVLRGFVGNSDKAAGRIKRGGGVRILALEQAPAPVDEILANPGSDDPEKLFDRAWVMEIVDRALERAKERCATAGRPWMFRVYEEYDLASDGARPTYAELESRLGLKPGAALSALLSVRRQVREEIRSELSKLSADDRGAEEEWNALF